MKFSLTHSRLSVVAYFPVYRRGVLKVAERCRVPDAGRAGLLCLLESGWHLGQVALLGSHVAGYSVSIGGRRDRWVVEHLAVDPTLRRQGVGTELARSLDRHCTWTGRTTLAATVPESDEAAWRFLAACGFRGLHVVRGRDGESDGWRFVRDVEAATETREPMCRGRR